MATIDRALSRLSAYCWRRLCTDIQINFPGKGSCGAGVGAVHVILRITSTYNSSGTLRLNDGRTQDLFPQSSTVVTTP